LFAWRQIAKMKNSANTNLLILDEVFDASLDTDGIDNLLKIMNTLDPETRVFVISHKQDLLEGKFDQKIEFERRQNFTRIKSIT
jgi:ABC-type Mn2+/Zn2+ transport system ATPase subunit